jgi:hypothetical protein
MFAKSANMYDQNNFKKIKKGINTLEINAKSTKTAEKPFTIRFFLLNKKKLLKK